MRIQQQFDRERPKIDIPDGFVMVQDTREQLPLFKPAPHIIDKALKTGDYSIVGMEELITIERKSISDLFGSLGGGRDNFEKRVDRMLKMKWAGLLIEGTENDVIKLQEFSEMKPNQIYHALSSYEVDGIHIYYAEKKMYARDWVLSRLTRFYKHFRRDD